MTLTTMTRSPITTTPVDFALQHSVEQFLYHEALLMDEHGFDEWFDLWHDDALYWVPCNAADADPSRSVCLIYERKPQIRARLDRLKGRHAHAQSPRSAMIRVLSNIVITATDGQTVHVASSFCLGEWRPTSQNNWFGRNFHQLIKSDDSWQIVEKKVVLLNNNAVMNNMTFLI
ncbi:MAG: hypothetical protein JWO15_2602 [Sphingomonadales bacterium]|nr:hypothetical protein [Sphingomonadales bacterium]